MSTLPIDVQTDDDSFVNAPALLAHLRAACSNPDCKRERVYMGYQVRRPGGSHAHTLTWLGPCGDATCSNGACRPYNIRATLALRRAVCSEEHTLPTMVEGRYSSLQHAQRRAEDCLQTLATASTLVYHEAERLVVCCRLPRPQVQNMTVMGYPRAVSRNEALFRDTGLTTYPKYMVGGGYILSSDVARCCSWLMTFPSC